MINYVTKVQAKVSCYLPHTQFNFDQSFYAMVSNFVT